MRARAKEFDDLLSNFHDEKIPNKNIRSIWRSFRPIKKLPKIEGYIVSTEIFNLFVKVFKTLLSKIGADPEAGEKREYGDITPPILNAFVSGINDVFYIFIDKEGNLTTYDSLKHEIKHIYDGDVKGHRYQNNE